MSPASMLLPCAAMAGLVFLVWLRLLVERGGEIRRRGIDPQSIATSGRVAAAITESRAADNFRNLFELPVLFYAYCLAVAVAGQADAITVGGAWLFVVLRAAHSAIQCSYNRVMHRFAAWMAGSLLLFALWARLGWTLALH